MRLLELAADCRTAGLEVVEIAGWQQRGRDLGAVGAVLAHHTATGPGTSDGAVDRLLRDGRPDLSGPLAQVGLDRAGRVRLIAAGVANHAGAGSWLGVSGNTRALGVEAYNDGRGEGWPPVQLDAWDRLNAVLLRTVALDAGRLCAHREWAPTRKIDPAGIDMDAMRRRAAALLTTTGDDMPLTENDRAMIRADVSAMVLDVLRKEGVSGAADGVRTLLAQVAGIPEAVRAAVADMPAGAVDTDALAASIVLRLGQSAGGA